MNLFVESYFIFCWKLTTAYKKVTNLHKLFLVLKIQYIKPNKHKKDFVISINMFI